MRHLRDQDTPHYVSDRLSAVSNVPTQLLVSVGVTAVILAVTSLTDFMPTRGEAVGFVDTETTSSIVDTTGQNPTISGYGGCHLSTASSSSLGAE
jgi:hypothetical protein